MMSAADDPFVSNAEGGTVRESHRYSSFDTQLFSLDASSPAQAKRALEAHLAETERRLEEASKLGTALIDQQRELSDKLKEVEHQQDVNEVGPELRQKLAELEKEYNEIGRETARAFLAPKRLAGVSDDAVPGTPSIEPKVYNAPISVACSLLIHGSRRLSAQRSSPAKPPTLPARWAFRRGNNVINHQAASTILNLPRRSLHRF